MVSMRCLCNRAFHARRGCPATAKDGRGTASGLRRRHRLAHASESPSPTSTSVAQQQGTNSQFLLGRVFQVLSKPFEASRECSAILVRKKASQFFPMSTSTTRCFHFTFMIFILHFHFAFRPFIGPLTSGLVMFAICALVDFCEANL